MGGESQGYHRSADRGICRHVSSCEIIASGVPTSYHVAEGHSAAGVRQRMNRFQVAMLVVELAKVGVREARDRAHRGVCGDLGLRLPLPVRHLQRCLSVKVWLRSATLGPWPSSENTRRGSPPLPRRSTSSTYRALVVACLWADDSQREARPQCGVWQMNPRRDAVIGVLNKA